MFQSTIERPSSPLATHQRRSTRVANKRRAAKLSSPDHIASEVECTDDTNDDNYNNNSGFSQPAYFSSDGGSRSAKSRKRVRSSSPLYRQSVNSTKQNKNNGDSLYRPPSAKAGSSSTWTHETQSSDNKLNCQLTRLIAHHKQHQQMLQRRKSLLPTTTIISCGAVENIITQLMSDKQSDDVAIERIDPLRGTWSITYSQGNFLPFSA